MDCGSVWIVTCDLFPPSAARRSGHEFDGFFVAVTLLVVLCVFLLSLWSAQRSKR